MDRRTLQALDLIMRFVERTDVRGPGARRYLWTDAFAVCTLLGLERAMGQGELHELALRLVERVHAVLGRHRGDDGRRGWLSPGGERQPTAAGLRIGKPLPERAPDEPFDAEGEWDRDGQYFHYLTKWMHALDQTARATRQPLFNRWARELAAAAHRAFMAGGRLMWKMSIDLTRPLVDSTGQHDPLDGYLTCAQLEATASSLPGAREGPSLAAAIADLGALIDRRRLATSDPLGLGGLLVDAHRAARLRAAGALPDDGLGDALRDAARAGLARWRANGELRLPAARRLAFRELGLSLGLAAAPGGDAAALRAEIEDFWQQPESRATATWREHEDINEVALAASLAPEGFLS
jgi:hypothetical protein